MGAKELSESFAELDDVVQTHPSMVEDLNPVIERIKRNELSAANIESVLAQYSLLPAMIVEFLTTGASRLQEWPHVKAELERNIGEEMGSRTEGLTHYAILKNGLLRELGLDVADVRAFSGTQAFLDSIRSGLRNQPEAYVAGMLYALETSAVPELMIVAKLVNEYATAIGSQPPIVLSGMSARKQIDVSLMNDRYSLNVFFASHLWDFEVGHKKRLATTLSEDLPVSSTFLKQFDAGFSFVMRAMDEWWLYLSKEDTHADLIYDGSVLSTGRSDLPIC